jgi:hypothetical protein
MAVDPAQPDDARASAAADGLLRAAAHADGAADLQRLSDAVAVHTAALEWVNLVAVIRYLTVWCGAATKAIDELTGSLERVAGTGSLERVTKSLEQPDE